MQKSNARLTVKEEEVLSCLVNNRTRKQIAAILDISENTIKTHIKNISIKLGCRSQTEIPQIAKNFYKLQSINRIYQKLNTMHNVHMFMAKNSSKLPFNGIIVKTLFVDRYQCLKSVFSKYEIQFDVIESKAVPLLKSVYDILHISRDQIIIVNNDHRKPLNFVVYNYDKARFIQAFFQKVFGDHIARFIAPIASTTDSKYKIKKSQYLVRCSAYYLA